MNPLIAHTPHHFPLCGISVPKYNNKNNVIFTSFDTIEMNIVFNHSVLKELIPCSALGKSVSALKGWLKVGDSTISTHTDRE